MKKIMKLLDGEGGNFILPFFWQHGENEETLRTYMKVIDESNVKAVCVESRPHPDYCGPKWWEDMDIILDEARKRSMKVWILDDSHFPTGYANGALRNQPNELQRQNLLCRIYDCKGRDTLVIPSHELIHPEPWAPSQTESMLGFTRAPIFDDDKLLGLYAIKIDNETGRYSPDENLIDLMNLIEDMKKDFTFRVPDGDWKVYALHLSRNYGSHSDYINMTDADSCKLLIDSVYEPHFKRYKNDFGKTIAGFFSDEPELGNGHLYDKGIVFPNYSDLPWSRELEKKLEVTLGKDYIQYLPLLWDKEHQFDLAPRIWHHYMDIITNLVKKNFSYQIGNWCRDHGVEYIGHSIEDDNQHSRLGSSLGHYFRGLAGQDMAGIDVIGGQVLPGQEELDITGVPFGSRIGEFVHYMLGKLGGSAAAIEPLKKGRAMCEIFGAYGWSEGVRLEKYLVDHFLVRGINHFVPHAFSPKEFPDPDCPPHFYAHGHNPQYRHFGKLMSYTNRVCELMNDGNHHAPVAVLYHGESEWSGKVMFSHKIGKILADGQVDFDILPQDIFVNMEEYKTNIEKNVLKVNTQTYSLFLVPEMTYITQSLAKGILAMKKANIHVFFINKLPVGLIDIDLPQNKEAELLDQLGTIPTMELGEIADYIQKNQLQDISIVPSDDRIRYQHYIHDKESHVYMFINEGDKTYNGNIHFAHIPSKSIYIYDAWNNTLEKADYENNILRVSIAPLKSLIVAFDTEIAFDQAILKKKIDWDSHKKMIFDNFWKRSLCKSINYPNFGPEKIVSIPDSLAEEEETFSGFVRYTNTFSCISSDQIQLEITDAFEGVEVFINGTSLGIQIAPPFVYNFSNHLVTGRNQLTIEVATTLERQFAGIPDIFGRSFEAKSPSGINGELYLKKQG